MNIVYSSRDCIVVFTRSLVQVQSKFMYSNLLTSVTHAAVLLFLKYSGCGRHHTDLSVRRSMLELVDLLQLALTVMYPGFASIGGGC